MPNEPTPLVDHPWVTDTTNGNAFCKYCHHVWTLTSGPLHYDECKWYNQQLKANESYVGRIGPKLILG